MSFLKQVCYNTFNRGKVIVFDNGPLWVNRKEIRVKLNKKFHYGKRVHNIEIEPFYGYNIDGTCKLLQNIY